MEIRGPSGAVPTPFNDPSPYDNIAVVNQVLTALILQPTQERYNSSMADLTELQQTSPGDPIFQTTMDKIQGTSGSDLQKTAAQCMLDNSTFTPSIEQHLERDIQNGDYVDFLKYFPTPP